jgi:competence protein ComEC
MLPGLVLSGLLVTVVTAPIALYHFQRLAVYGTFSNVIAIPLTGLLIMPALLGALLLWSVGGEGFFLSIAAWGAQCLNRLAETVTTLPYAQWRVAAFSPMVAFLILLALPMAISLPRWYRLSAVIPLFVASIIVVRSPLPDVVIADTGKQAGFYEQGTLWVSGPARSFLAREWANRYGLPGAILLPADACDETGCLIHFQGKTIALPQVPDAVSEDCRYKNRIIITSLDAPADCRARIIHDYRRLRYNGSTALWLDSGKTATDRQKREGEPWAGYE